MPLGEVVTFGQHGLDLGPEPRGRRQSSLGSGVEVGEVPDLVADGPPLGRCRPAPVPLGEAPHQDIQIFLLGDQVGPDVVDVGHGEADRISGFMLLTRKRP